MLNFFLKGYFFLFSWCLPSEVGQSMQTSILVYIVSRLPHLLMIVMHGETLWSPAPQPMDDDYIVTIQTHSNVKYT